MNIEAYESEWKPALGWVVRGAGRSGLPTGGILKFEGRGDGSPESLVLLEGTPWGERCVYDPQTDSVTFVVLGQGQYRATRNGSTLPASLVGALSDQDLSTGGSWTAEEGSAGGRGGRGGLG